MEGSVGLKIVSKVNLATKIKLRKSILFMASLFQIAFINKMKQFKKGGLQVFRILRHKVTNSPIPNSATKDPA